MSYDTAPERVWHLLSTIYGLRAPSLVISVHGGTIDEDMAALSATLHSAIRRGLGELVRASGAWIISSGVNAGVGRVVASAITAATGATNVVAIGVASWGMLHERARLVGHNKTVTMMCDEKKGRHHRRYRLNDRHNYFLLVDNGTIGRQGVDIVLRQRIEDYIARRVSLTYSNLRVPLVCLVGCCSTAVPPATTCCRAADDRWRRIEHPRRAALHHQCTAHTVGGVRGQRAGSRPARSRATPRAPTRR